MNSIRRSPLSKTEWEYYENFKIIIFEMKDGTKKEFKISI